MNQNTKRLVILNLPYILMGLYATNLGRAWRMAAGADMTEKMQSLMAVLPDALGRIIPSFHPLYLLVGLCCGVGLRPAVYLKGTERGDASFDDKKGVKSGREQQPAHKILDILNLKGDHNNLLCFEVLKTVYMELKQKAIDCIMA